MLRAWLPAAARASEKVALLRNALSVAGLSIALAAPTSAAAQAGSAPREPALEQREQLERIEQWRREQERRAPLTREPATSSWQLPLAGESPCFAVNSVRIVLAEPSVPDVREAAQNLLGPVQQLRSFGRACLGATSLERLRSNLQGRLAARGYITSTLTVPAQDLSQGELLLLLQPGLVEAVAVEGAQTAPRPAANALALQPGDVLNLRDIEQTLENLARLPSQSSRFVVEPGTTPGASVVRILPMQPDAALWRLNLGAERPEGRDYGDVQINGQVSVDHALRLSEQAGLWVAHSQGEKGPGTARPQQTIWYAYLSVPLGRHLLSISHSRADYRRLIAAGVGQLRDTGRDASSRVRWEWTFWRGEAGRVQGWAAASQRRARTTLDDIELISRRRLGTSVEQGLSLWGRVAPCDLSLELEGTQVQRLERDSDFQPPTDGLPRSWRAETSWACALGASFDYSGQVSMQRIAQPVDGSDLLVLGTRQTVRAHAPADALSGRGLALVRQEWLLPALRIGANAALRPAVSLDWGRIHAPIDGGQASRELTAMALGVRWQAGKASGQFSAQRALRPPARGEGVMQARHDARLQASFRISL